MKDFLRLTDFNSNDIFNIFKLTDKIKKGKYKNFLKDKTVVMFFPSSSLRTRVTFEKGIAQLGGQSILFPPETLEKKEDLQDVFGYLDNWSDITIVRYKDISLLEKIAQHSSKPVINAMTSTNHPCEILSDLYSLYQSRKDFLNDRFLFCGKKGNIGLAWKEASKVMGFSFEQCCPNGYEIEEVKTHISINEAIVGKDIILTDSLSEKDLKDFSSFQITKEIMDKANPNAILNPCPPFFRGEEVSSDVVNSKYFVGYNFKQNLLSVQQAIMIYCLS